MHEAGLKKTVLRAVAALSAQHHAVWLSGLNRYKRRPAGLIVAGFLLRIRLALPLACSAAPGGRQLLPPASRLHPA